MIDVKVQQITGLAELERRLERLPGDMERTIVFEALREGAQVIVAAARARAPLGRPLYAYAAGRVKNHRKIGQLRKSIRSMGRAKKQGGSLVLPIGFSAAGYYGRFLERGWTPTGPHKKWRSDRHLTVKSARRVLQTGRRKMPALRFMMNAATQQMAPAVEAVAKSVERGLAAWGK